ncbi:uncharacterized protein BJ212DRAFT_1592119 [Suillus subaureus]|uniref:Uncharacterized protein n=1 Tax=Suillus subaureus TaxID=48587 RepID=A0A9P7ATT4_9AGAM|nr:uncharacterized protein BJ212DRAFT_1592119 [Suillus subaureus]KAG1796573.1 hypothetical protein BJ212DRAFT_1592119 [Suillus subaureus]
MYKAYAKSIISHNAVNMANVKTSRGLAATGVGTVDCARHDMKLPNGVGDLQKGENKNVRCTDGKAPKRGWANINCVASSEWMLHKIKQASSRSKLHREELHELGHTIPALSLSAWRSEIIAWEEDHTKPNPFRSRVLAKKDAADLQSGADILLHTEISPSILIVSGIDLQDQQETPDNVWLWMHQHWASMRLTHKNEDIYQSNTLQCQLDNWNIHLFTHLNIFRVTKIHAGKAKYDAAQAALVALTPQLGKTGWSNILHPLLVLDMRPMGDFIQGQSEGCTLSRLHVTLLKFSTSGTAHHF